ncbi:MAG: dephospho-CoA kinase [Betaproteobacteria bacterium]|nr:dephospho-CoA kinase [Betaproteobacteria bacterium]NBY14589.1 dephospho-CoA kinase [Betaproteobacteria bacterium]NCA15561.1 dephospho-CoA kinase [Betaproteobacteria bacterium]NDF04761.1 dephospho-CoA kinase [Betaproteobacteria bacterium]
MTAPPVLVLTGGMGAGKSSACNAFRSLGIAIVDADEIAHRVTASGGRAIPGILSIFGSQLLQEDGALNRDAMRSLAFKDPEALRQLEGIVHPLVRDEARLELARAQGPYVVYAVPLWVETQGSQRPDWVWRVVVIDLPEDLQRARVLARQPIAQDTLDGMLARQATRAQRLAAADIVLSNNGTPDDLRAAVRELHRSLLACLDQRSPPQAASEPGIRP